MSSPGDTQTALSLALMGPIVLQERHTHPRQQQPKVVRPGMGKHRTEEAPNPGWKGWSGRASQRGKISRKQLAMHLLNEFSQPLAPTGMQGSTPLDVAAASVIDNNELALALQEQDLEKVWREETWTLGHLLIQDPL